MKIDHHPKWPKDPETLLELQNYLRSHFKHSFTNQDKISEITNVKEWVESDSPLVLTYEGSSSFFTFFISFHTGTPFMKKMMAQYHFPDQLLRFLETCTILEKTTDQFAYVDSIEEINNKDIIISYLQRFLDELPTKDEFSALIEQIVIR